MYMALRSACVLLAALLLPGLGTLVAQSESTGSDSRVEKLYADAKMDEATGDLAGAIAKYKSILRVAPDVGPAYNNLGALYFKQRDYAKAAAVLQQGLKVDRNMVSASALLGMSLFQMGKYAEARVPLEETLRANPKDNNIDQRPDQAWPVRSRRNAPTAACGERAQGSARLVSAGKGLHAAGAAVTREDERHRSECGVGARDFGRNHGEHEEL
jgi:tetratricopeptide (TPR) repeat protein